jgi:serine/threonine protein kinase
MNEPDEQEVAIFGTVLLMPADQRAAYLDEACAGNDALRRRIEAHLSCHSEAGSFLEDPVPGAPGLGEAVIAGNYGEVLHPKAAHSEKTGDRIGRYKLLEQIGEGGCGVVYMAEQQEPVRRRVALKVIKLGMDTRQVIARFEAERQALALMDHPNIAKVFDAGATETGRPFFVMELVRGVKITDYCDENQLHTAERLELFIQVCQAIQHAHQKGVIHRDIKPSNILVTVNDGVAVPKVIDFGVAKATQGRLTNQTLFTAFEQFIGTPAYMSPEQAVMTSLDVDTRSDIYSLGVLLYELLTGKTPFDAKKLMASGIDVMRKTIREMEPVRPSTRFATLDGEELTKTAKRRSSDISRMIHQIKGDLDWIVMKCLEKDRSRRYDSASALAADVKRHLDNQAIAARPPSTAYRIQKALRRNKTAFAVAGLIAAVLVTATGISAWQAIRATRAETMAKERLAEAEDISKFLTDTFQSPDPTRDGRTITVAETVGIAAAKLDADLASQPARRAKLLATLGMTYRSLGLSHEAIPLLERVRDYYLATAGAEDPDTLKANHNLALVYDETDRHSDALKLREQVLALRRKVLGPEHPDTLKAMRSLAFSYYKAGRCDEALKLREQVLALYRKISGPEDPETLWATTSLATSYDDAGRRREALAIREQVAALCLKVSGPKDPATLLAMLCLATSYFEAGRFDEALKLQEELLALHRMVSGPEHPATLWVMNNLANSYDATGRRDEALKMRGKVLELRRKVLGAENVDTLIAMGNLAISYAKAGRHDEALRLREDVMALYRKLTRPEHPDRIDAMGNLASSYAEAGRYDEALKLREDVVALYRKVNGPEHPDTVEAMGHLADSFEEVGHSDEALKLRKEVVALYVKVNGPEHPDTIEAMHKLALSCAEIGSQEEARQNYQAILPRYERLAVNQPANITFKIELAKVRRELGDVFAEMGRSDTAATHYQSGLQMADAILSSDAANDAAAKVRLACRIGLGLEKSEVVVQKVLPRSLAEAAGLRQGDVLVGYAGQPLVSAANVSTLTGRAKGTDIELEIRRNGAPLKLSVAPGPLGARCEDRPTAGRGPG